MPRWLIYWKYRNWNWPCCAAPITKIDSLLSLPITANSLLAIVVTALLFLIVAAIGIAIASNKIKKLMKSLEKEPRSS
ncbi:hypothetical protein WBP_0578 [Wolbachia endosymbiont of Brugia pahangi]|nr:hypothetical protein WBP_0578 [Wolbachia endosymbiont of Brugia pahangi]